MLRAPTFIVINLDRDTDRLAHMERQLNKAGFAFERFPAIKGAELPESLRAYFPDSGFKADRTPLSLGEIGCYASHLAICRRVVDGSLLAPVCVLEDDVELPPDFDHLLTTILERLPAVWDIVRLSNDTKRSVMPLDTLRGQFQLVRYTNVPGSTGASLLSRSGAEKFLKQAARSLPVDQDLRRVWVWNLNTFGVTPTPVRRDIFDVSSIDAMADAGWRTKRWRIARMRRRRVLEAPARHLYGMRTFGIGRWIMAELINVIVALTPKKRRSQTLASLSARLSPRSPRDRAAMGLHPDAAI